MSRRRVIRCSWCGAFEEGQYDLRARSLCKWCRPRASRLRAEAKDQHLLHLRVKHGRMFDTTNLMTIDEIEGLHDVLHAEGRSQRRAAA